MKFRAKIITIEELIKLYEENKLDLNPPYQRNEIWSMNSKTLLIDSIKRGFPLPNFFILEKDDGKYEMVDGQQRSRTIIGYYKGLFPDMDKNYYDSDKFIEFLKYELAVIYINQLENNEAIENFYARVNSTGLKLNRPELLKAQYYDTRFLHLLETLSISKEFDSLNLFSDASINRMNDVDFVGELVSLIENGITDKKSGVDRLFEQDISKKDFERINDTFKNILKIILRFNEIFPINKTRYKQRNDFYTLFNFILSNPNIEIDNYSYIYKILVLIDENISPSNEKCLPFKEYALHCVSQSNSSKAREERLSFFNDLFLNPDNELNESQEEIIKYYELDSNKLVNKGKYYTIQAEKIQEVVKVPKLFN